MLPSSSLQIPKPAGRSRFSKALPAIPGLDASRPELPSVSTLPFSTSPAPVSASSSTPRPVQQDLPPPPTPRHNDDPRIPIQYTPLPPLPGKRSQVPSPAPDTPVSTTTTTSTSTSASANGPPKMTISRKPVARKPVGAKPPPPQQQQQHSQSPSQSQPASQQQQQQVQQQKQQAQQLPQVPQKEQKKEQAPPIAPSKSASRTESTSRAPQLPQLLSHPNLELSLDPPPKSPSDSLSSLLSAYSRSSTASVVRSSDGTAYSAPDYPPNKTQVHTAPTQPAPSSTRHEANPAGAQQGRNLTRQPMPMGNSTISSQPRPPPPSKDDDTVQRPSSPAQPLDGEPKLGAPSPPRQQIWQRRSLKGSRELPDLRLNHSHGATASTSTISTITATQKPQPPPKSPPPPALPEKSTTNTVDSSARDKTPDPPAKNHRTMGQVASKLDRLRNKFHSPHVSMDSTKSAKSDQTAPSVKRPPTPEYRKEDRKADDVNTFVSPVSPASSPEPAKKTASDAPATLSEQMSSGSCPDELRPRARKPAPAPVPAPTLQPAKSLPDLKTNVPPPTSTEPLPPASAFPASGRNSPAFDMAPRGRQPGPPGAYPPSSRNTSARPSSRGSVRPGGGLRFPPPESDPRLVRSPSGEFMYKGRDGTLYPEMKENPNPDPRAARFPKQCEELPSPGAVFKAAPLKTTHFECYQRHKNMLRRPNRRYPLACQTCQRHDSDDRFSCSFCYVRMCESCLKLFETKQRDLRALLDELSSSGTLSLSSPTRPGSALGLQINV